MKIKKIHIIRNKHISTKKVICLGNEETNQRGEKLSKKISKSITFKIVSVILSLIFIPIITSYIADYMISESIKKISEEEKTKNQLNTFENIYIGCSKEWLDERLGAPTFKYKYKKYPKDIEFNLLCCVYVTDIALVRVYFDETALSCKAYFVTSTNEEYSINLPETYKRFVNDKPIGEFSYYDIMNIPNCLGGGKSNGNVRTIYGEVYYFLSAGNYYYFTFGTVDYGINPSMDLSMLEEEIEWDDEIEPANTRVLGLNNIKNRKMHYPNTFGIVAYPITDELAWELLCDYNGFDSFQLKDDPFYYLKDDSFYSERPS